MEADPSYAPARSKFAKLFLERTPDKYGKFKSRIENSRLQYEQARHDNPQRFNRNHSQQNAQQQKIIFLCAEEMFGDTSYAQEPQDSTALADMKSGRHSIHQLNQNQQLGQLKTLRRILIVCLL